MKIIRCSGSVLIGPCGIEIQVCLRQHPYQSRVLIGPCGIEIRKDGLTFETATRINWTLRN